jgi:hypothetical protein
VELIVATAVFPLVHTPPGVVLESRLVVPAQTEDEPDMAGTTGTAFIVIDFVTGVEQLPLVTV